MTLSTDSGDHREIRWASYSARVLAAREREAALEKAGICGCGHRVDDCRPEVCSHKFAHDAIWGN